MKYIKIEDTKHIKNHGDILACKYYHNMYPNGSYAIGDCESNKVNGKEWDIFHVHYETEDAYYGIPMLGMGLMNCMIMKSDTRGFLEDELEYSVDMYGSHSSKFARGWNIEIDPVVNKL